MFFQKILSSDIPRVLCKLCWAICEGFHEFLQIVASNYAYQDYNDIKVKIETIGEIDEEEAEAYEEYTQDEPIEELKAENDYEEFYLDAPDHSPTVKKKRKNAKSRTKIQADDKKICLFSSMACEVCSRPLESMANATSHYKKEHDMKGYLKCCGRRFTQRYRLVHHVNTHLNISYMWQVRTNLLEWICPSQRKQPLFLLILILGGKKQYLRSGNRSSAIGAENILQKKVKKSAIFLFAFEH